jgi:effector-binding domain-containing protein
MKLLRNLLLLVVVLVVGAFVAGFFLLPPEAKKEAEFTIDRPASAVYANLASAPANYALAEGVTQTVTSSQAPGTVEADVVFANNKKARVVYNITGQGASSVIKAQLKHALGMNPLDRLQGMSGAHLAPVLAAAETKAKADSSALPQTDFSGLSYVVEQVAPRNFLYIEAATPTAAEGIKEGIRQALRIVRQSLASNNLAPAGNPIAIETAWQEGQAYSFQAGIPYTGPAPTLLIGVKNGQTPAGSAIKVKFYGTEEQIIPVYDQIEALIAAARLKRSGPSFEVFLDDPDSATGSQTREIYHIVEGDTAALARVAPPAPAAAAPAVAPAPVTPATPAAATTPAPAATTTPAAATTPAPAPAPTAPTWSATPAPAPATPEKK